jgi:diguanylate cyclase (GGDEF)-like protein
MKSDVEERRISLKPTTLGGIYTSILLLVGYVLNYLIVPIALLSAAVVIAASYFIFSRFTWQKDAKIDQLTGCHNRAALESYLESFNGRQACVMMIDIDDFKMINDTFGHDAGDRILREVGYLLSSYVRPGEVYRYGGEEFAIIMKDVPNHHVYEIADRIRKAVEHNVNINGHPITVSIGIACSVNPKVALKAADEFLYISKRKGKNTITY